MPVVDLRGTGRWPKELPNLTEEQSRIRDEFMARWLSVLPNKYGVIERFNHGYAAHAVPPRGRTLEIGPGVGAHLSYENLDSQDYFAVELREELISELKSRYPQVSVVAGDCQERLPFDDAFFDRVLAIHVLEHLPNLPAALNEISRVLKQQGRFVVVIPCEGGFAYSLGRRVSAQRLFECEFGMSYEWLIRSEHLSVPWEIIKELKTGFRIVNSRYFPLRLHAVALNLAIGLTLEPIR